ncbi:MAG TPA: hypothetical protein IAB51_10805 [Candidatus Merdivicinus excrementipullorum]|uniref:Uncharacterized protein n=1 Tax=Candidatus Merdivicinus excrementipullorum TaxID=2840867 RepID=A0A9D1FQ33_9FIRM|nr:hypothetical protein [Candidatus Merdivicinus excrementipullorum]
MFLFLEKYFPIQPPAGKEGPSSSHHLDGFHNYIREKLAMYGNGAPEEKPAFPSLAK